MVRPLQPYERQYFLKTHEIISLVHGCAADLGECVGIGSSRTELGSADWHKRHGIAETPNLHTGAAVRHAGITSVIRQLDPNAHASTSAATGTIAGASYPATEHD